MKTSYSTIERIERKGYVFTATPNGCQIQKVNKETMAPIGSPTRHTSATAALKSITRQLA